MSTLSTNQIVVEYIIKEGDIRKAQQNFDKLTESEKRAILETKNLNAEIKNVGTTSEKAFTSALTPLKNSADAVRTFTTNLKVAAQAAVEAGNKATAGFTGITAAEKKAEAGAKAFNDKLVQLGTTLKTTGSQGKKATDDVSDGLGKVGGIVGKIGPLMAAAFSIGAISEFTKQVIETTIKFEGYSKAIQFGSGSVENFTRNQQFLTEIINKYGLGLESTTEAYKSFLNASTLAGQSQQETNRQFEAVTKAGTVLKLTTDQMQGAFLALGQMMSKGTVQAEELRGQLGERIPGAFSIMAKALGVNEMQLNKMLEQGQVLSKIALPAFAAELEKTFGPEAEKNLNGLVNSQNRFNTAMDKMILTIGTGLKPALQDAYDSAASFLNRVNSFFTTDQQKIIDKINANQAKSLDYYQKLLLKVSDQGIKNIIKNAEKEKNVIIEEDKKKRELFKTLIEKRKVAGEETGSNFFSRRARVKEYDEEIKLLQEANTKRVTIVADYNAQISAANDELAKREKERSEIKPFEKTEKELKKEYDLRLNLLNIQTQIRKLEQDSQAGQLGADKAFYDAKLKLQNDFRNQGLNIRKEETDLTKAQGKKAAEDLLQVEKGALMERYKATVITDDDLEKRRKKAMDQTVSDNKEMMAELDRQRDLALQREEDRIKYKQKLEKELLNQSFDLAVNVTNSLFTLQSQYDQNAFNRKMKAYDEELRLAGDNVQKQNEIAEKRAAAEKEYRTKEFKANQLQAIANAVFAAAPSIIKYTAGLPVTAANLALTLGALTAQTTFILAQPTPEFAEGTKGKPFKGGKAIVGEIGKEWVVTTSGQVYETPGVATLVDLPKGSQVIPNKDVLKTERFMGSKLFGQSKSDSGTGQVVERLMSIENTLSKLPITSLTMDERGFTKKIQTKSRETKILNNRFGN